MSVHRNKFLASIALFCFCIISNDILANTAWLKSDPFPVFTSLDPQTFLYTREKLQLKGWETEPKWYDKIDLSISPFGVNAYYGHDIRGHFTELGDINYGRWNMITLLYGELPQGKSYGPLLSEALNALFPNGVCLNDPDLVDPARQFGFFSFPCTFKKRGLRVQFDAMILGDFGISIQAGMADQCQTVTHILNLTPLTQGGFPICLQVPAAPCSTTPVDINGCKCHLQTCDVNKYLMDRLQSIAHEIDLNIYNFHKFSVEEIRFNLFWRHAFPINLYDEEYPEFLLIPFFQLQGSISPGKELSPNKAFGVPFGNNRHSAVGIEAGLNMDFFDTIEIGGEVGYKHFFRRDCVEMRVPNSIYQTGIFPFSTNVSYQPGKNLYYAAKLSAYHFLDKLSMYFQYVLEEHSRDHICVLNEDPAFKPHVLERWSDWKVHLANVGFTYDFSPNIALGFFWQAPLVQRRVYKTTTVLFDFVFTY